MKKNFIPKRGNPVIKRKGMKCIASFDKDEVMGITTFRNKLIIATKKGVFMYPKKKRRKV